MHSVVKKELLTLSGGKSETQPENGPYTTVRHGVSKTIHVIGVKNDIVTYKESLDRTDSATIPLAKFLKFYNPE
jgi:hypothetical protein